MPLQNDTNSNDTLEGSVGADIMVGGGGNDTYVVNHRGDVVTEDPDGGSDQVRSSISYVLGSNVENLILVGSTALNGTGNTTNNALTGNAGANTLDGGAGADTMTGGGGGDIYIVDNAGDMVVEDAESGGDSGADQVRSSISYVLGAFVENLLLTGIAALSGTGNASNNAMTGNDAANYLDGGAGNDTLDGGSGADTMVGGTGGDVYIVDSRNDVVTEGSDSGIDEVRASVSFTLGNYVENLILTGIAALSGTGNAADNAMTGNDAANYLDGGAGNDTLNGGIGADTMSGGAGNDVYVVDTAGDLITESANGGADQVRASISYTLGSNLENLVLTGTSALNGTGNGSSNAMTGNDAANILDGGAGADTMAGAGGDDGYVVDNAADVIIEDADAGADQVRSSISYTLGSNVENLALTGTAALNGTGNGSDNGLIGNSAANVLDGGAGNDTLDGGAGADTLIGGGGDDGYVVDNASDVVTETANGGMDQVRSSISYVLGSNVENLKLTGLSALNGTGNGSDNAMTGNGAANLLDGGAGNDTLDGGMGADTLLGGGGDDAYIVDSADDVVTEAANAGADEVHSSVSYVLGNYVENLILTGIAALSGTGNATNNVMTGNDAANILDGGAGADTMAGGGGDDGYVVDNAADVITEDADSGADQVRSSVNFTLSAFVENLILTGIAALNGTGNSSNNAMTGNDAANFLDGGAGNDTLDGGTGADTMVGGTGGDVYIVDNANDVVTEGVDAGADQVRSSVSYTLGSNVENLTLTGSSALNGTGNASNNALSGNGAANLLDGGAGNDTLDGGAGADTMAGGGGDDAYVVDTTGDVVIEEANAGADQVRSSISYVLGSNIENLTLVGFFSINATGNASNNALTGNGVANLLDGGVGADTMSGGGGDDGYIVDNAGDVVVETANGGADQVRSAVSYVLGNYVENLILTGIAALSGTGNASSNAMTGNDAANFLDGGAGNDTLDGGTGADTMVGGTGGDVFIVDNAGDVVTEGSDAGADQVQSSVSYTLGNNVENLTLTGSAALNGTGNASNNAMTGTDAANILDGGAGNDTLDGGSGADTMIGGTGGDVFIVDNANDVVTEGADVGADQVQSSVSYVLGSNVENLTLTGSAALNGTGNASNNAMTGTDAANILDGGAGADTMTGGGGGDIYVVDNAGDVVIESANAGADLVRASISYALGSYVENLILTGIAALTGTGNATNNNMTGNDAANFLDGGAGNDTLDGGSGADTMVGGTGGDLFIVDNVNDVVTEAQDAGADQVQTSVSYVLGAYVENLILAGVAAISGTGNATNNNMTGNDAANFLDGGAGNDTLDGGSGADTMVGGTGGDLFIVDNVNDVVTEAQDAGADQVQTSVSYVLGAYVENLLLSGIAAISGTGNAANNNMTGNDSANILDGGAGADTMAGAGGDDGYVVDNAGDVIIEDADSGADQVISSVSYVLSAYVENLILTGIAAITGKGNASNNNMTGNDAANFLEGGAGNDTLDGGAGADTMTGGESDDVYVIDNAGDVINENPNGGADHVRSSITYVLGANVENLSLMGTGALNATGNSLNNVLTGNLAANQLYGGAGNDTLDGGDGADTLLGMAGNDSLDGGAGGDQLIGGSGKDMMTGGLGNDVFVFNDVLDTGATALLADVIKDFAQGQDRIDLSALDAFVATSVNDTFTWRGTNAFASATQGEVRFEKYDNSGTSNDYTMVLIDNDADPVIELAIRLNGLYVLTAGDFLL